MGTYAGLCEALGVAREHDDGEAGIYAHTLRRTASRRQRRLPPPRPPPDDDLRVETEDEASPPTPDGPAECAALRQLIQAASAAADFKFVIVGIVAERAAAFPCHLLARAYPECTYVDSLDDLKKLLLSGIASPNNRALSETSSMFSLDESEGDNGFMPSAIVLVGPVVSIEAVSLTVPQHLGEACLVIGYEPPAPPAAVAPLYQSPRRQKRDSNTLLHHKDILALYDKDSWAAKALHLCARLATVRQRVPLVPLLAGVQWNQDKCVYSVAQGDGGPPPCGGPRCCAFKCYLHRALLITLGLELQGLLKLHNPSRALLQAVKADLPDEVFRRHALTLTVDSIFKL